MKELKMDDVLTFKNHKGEEYKITRQEFRNAAKAAQGKDNSPTMSTPKEREFYYVP